MDDIKLNTGNTIPEIGFGVWQIDDQKQFDVAINAALDAGYRHFDTAQNYENEQYLGAVLRANGEERDELFITTKIWTDNFAPHKLQASFDESLEKLQMDYVDLLLLHYPVTGTRQEAWTQMEKIYVSGKAKAIGVSNYTIRHLEELLATSKVMPAVNQVELHVFLQQPELLAYCKQHKIVVEAYSPLAHGHGLDNPVLKSLGDKYEKSTAQIMIRWCIEAGTVPLPKSSTPERIEANFDVYDFEFDAEDKAALAKLEAGLRTCWDAENVD
jgi:diketogulonate reductase-like aldo/keto reductase